MARRFDPSTLAVFGILAGLVLPIAGLGFALVLFVRGQAGEGLAVLCASAIGAVIYLAAAGG